MTKSSRKRRECLLGCATRHLSLKKTNTILAGCALDSVSSREWILWLDYYAPLINCNPHFATELINNGRTLPWLVRELNNRNKKLGIS